jgi:hypothetical protein
MFGFGHLILILITYSQTYPQKLWIESRLFLQQIEYCDTVHAESAT